MKTLLTALASLIFVAKINAQAIGIGTTTPSASAQLEVAATDKGFLIPRISLVTLTDVTTISNPATGLLIYNTNSDAGQFPDGTGFYYWNGSNWIKLITTGASVGSGWLLNGNSGTNPQNHFLGTRDNVPFKFRTNNLPSGIIDPVNSNTSLGTQAMGIIQGGFSNVAIGTKALFSNINGNHHVAVGDSAMYYHNEGFGFNTAVGSKAMFGSVNSAYNTAIGAEALYNMSTAIHNVAVGVRALYTNNGQQNTGIGTNALYSNTIGSDNTAIGYQAMFSNMDGSQNIAIGARALYANIDATHNVAIGTEALRFSTTALMNTAVGSGALRQNITGHSNTAIGNSALGFNETGGGNTAAGWNSGPLSTNLTNTGAFGYDARVNISNKIVIGNNNVTVIGGAVGWSTLSDGRFKKDIREDVPGLSFIMKLRPVTYRLDNKKFELFLGKKESEIDVNESNLRSGFIAQEVEASAVEAGYNFSGLHKPVNEKDNYALSYSDFVVPIIKAMQEQQLIIEKLQKQNEELLRRLEALESKSK